MSRPLQFTVSSYGNATKTDFKTQTKLTKTLVGNNSKRMSDKNSYFATYVLTVCDIFGKNIFLIQVCHIKRVF